MNRGTGLLALALATLLAIAPLAPSGAAAHASAVPLGHLADVLPRLDLARRLGSAPTGAPLDLVVTLAHPDPAGEEAAYAAIYDPASPQYHHFLTPAAYAGRFGVARRTVAAAESWLRSGGMRIVDVSPAGDVISVAATVGSASRLFRTPLDSYRYQGSTFTANAAPAAIPAALPVATVLGLNTLQAMHPASLTGPAPAPGAGGSDGPFDERDLWKIYDMPDANQGQGQSVAVIGAGDIAPVVANLRVFELRHGLPTMPVRVVETQPGDHHLGVGNEVEWNLDSDAVTGMAPAATQLVYYFANNLGDAGTTLSFARWANDPNGPLQASASFGECETDPLNPLVGNPLLDPPTAIFGQGLGDNMELASEPILRQATLEGRTLFAATGDSAGLCPAVSLPIIGVGNGLLPGTAPFQSYPAVSRYAVAVGGTVLASNAARTRRARETSWTFGGGGSSFFVAEPGYQEAIGAGHLPCLVDPTGRPYPGGTVCRTVPDIAADSGGGIPLVSSVGTYRVVEDMADTAQGGTSLSAPLSAGMWARIQAAAPAGGLGFANESFYRLARGPGYHRDFYDVTASELGLGNLTNRPRPGYDATSGLGVMDVAHLMDDLDHRRTPTDPVTAPPVAAEPLGCGLTGVFTSAAGNATDPVTGANDRSLDFTGGGFALSPDGRSLVVSMNGPGLSPAPLLTAVGGTRFVVYWTYAGVTYFAQARASVEGVSYSDGHLDPAAGPAGRHTIGGTFSGGTLTMTVPLADIGGPRPGALLRYPYGAVIASTLGIPGAVTILSQTVDAGSTDDYRIGHRC